jgi:hypothetical protein
MGAICNFRLEAKRAASSRDVDFDAYTIQFSRHHKGLFLMLVKTPEEGDVYQPREGVFCFVKIQGLEHTAAISGKRSE